MLSQVQSYDSDTFETIFDPQLYYPRSDRGCLPSWDYFPNNVDSADLSTKAWWEQLVSGLAKEVCNLKPTSVASPAVVPKFYDNDYYNVNRVTASLLAEQLAEANIETLQTVLVSLHDLSQPNRCSEIASIVSGSELDRVYLIFVGDAPPRRELQDSISLTGACKLIKLIAGAGMSVMVGCSALDAVLWLSSGAEAVAIGKFFNLRRFTAGRWDDPSGGGGQLPYWTSLDLMALLRGPDVVRLIQNGIIDPPGGADKLSNEILERIQNGDNQSWVGLSWRHYLSRFRALVNYCGDSLFDPHVFLDHAEKKWKAVENANILMEEPANDGTWVRPWRIALRESK